MEGQSVVSKLRFIESKIKLKVANQDVIPSAGCKLISAANDHQVVIVGSQEDRSIKAIPFDQLMVFNQSQKSQVIPFQQFKFTLALKFTPHIVTVARNGYSSVLLVVGQNIVEAFDLDNLTSIGSTQLNTAEVIDYAWHPNYFDSIVTLCTKQGELLVIYINKSTKTVSLVYYQHHGVLSCCWSPKGKNLAIGMSDGRVKRLEPVISATSFTFKDVDKSIIAFSHPRITPQHRLIKLRWISKTHLLGIHSKAPNPAGSDTLYSMFTVKPSSPYKYWTSICFESQNVQEQNYYIANLSDAAVCSSNSSGEAAVLGLHEGDWKSLIIDEEGARIELPLDSNSVETLPRGLTLACFDKQPVLVFYTSGGIVCPYMSSEPSLKIPPLQPPAALNFTPQLAAATLMSTPRTTSATFISSSQATPSTFFSSPQIAPTALTTSPQMAQSSLSFSPQAALASLSFNSQPAPATLISNHRPTPATLNSNPQPTPATLNSDPQSTPASLNSNQQLTPPSQISNSQVATKSFQNPQIYKSMQELSVSIKNFKVVTPNLNGVNEIRRDLEEISEIHKLHREASDAIDKDIQWLDAGMLENLYLIEYIKTNSKKQSRKRYLDPTTKSKVDSMRSKLEAISHHLRDVNNNIEVTWSQSNNKTRFDSLETIYKALATQQKIINNLKRKASNFAPRKDEPSSLILNESTVPTRELDPARLNAFKAFLASRDTIPLRRPECHQEEHQNVSRSYS